MVHHRCQHCGGLDRARASLIVSLGLSLLLVFGSITGLMFLRFHRRSMYRDHAAILRTIEVHAKAAEAKLDRIEARLAADDGGREP